MTLKIYDPPMCCSTGVCGPEVNPALVRFGADLKWIEGQGIKVERYNLSQSPMAFAENDLVRSWLTDKGEDALPLIIVDDKVAVSGRYPERAELANILGLGEPEPSMFTQAVAELVAIGAAIAANCEPCFKYHYNEARKLGVSNADMAKAVAMAKAVKEAPARSVSALADKILGTTATPQEAGAPTQGTCCGTAEPASSIDRIVSGKRDGGSCCG